MRCKLGKHLGIVKYGPLPSAFGIFPLRVRGKNFVLKIVLTSIVDILTVLTMKSDFPHDLRSTAPAGYKKPFPRGNGLI